MTDIRALLDQAIGLAGSQAKLGRAAGMTQNAIWQAKRRGRVSPQLALGIHWALGGAVSASELRPDIWARPQDVPCRPIGRAGLAPYPIDIAEDTG